MRAGWGAAAVTLLLGTGVALFAQQADQGAPGTQAARTGEGASVTLTVDQAIARALANQPLIQQAQAAVEAARARVGQANSAYFPRIGANASYARVEPDQSIAFPGLGNFSLIPVNVLDFDIGLNQVVYQFGRRGIQVKLAESGLSAAQIGVEQIKTSLAFQAAQGFYTVLFLKDQLAELDREVQNLQQHLEDTRVKEQAGAATRYDELSTEVRVSTLRSQRIEAESTSNKQVIGLKQLLGIDESASLDLKGDFTAGQDPLESEQTLISSAMAHRPEVRQAAEAERAAELSRRLATIGALPTITAHGSVGYKNGILTSQNLDINALQFNWAAGVQVNVPIFDGFLIAKQGEEADKKLQAARENSLAVRRTVTTQVLQAMQDVEAGHKQAESADTQQKEAQEMVEVVKLQYDLGMLSNLEYLDAQAAFERTQLGSLQAHYREVLNQYALKQATGAALGEPSEGSSTTPGTSVSQ
jgi:outer membrane protein